MAQSSTTCTPPSPTPPSNFSFVGATPPQPPMFPDNTLFPLMTSPPYFDDGSAGSATAFAANHAALASGTAAGNWPAGVPGGTTAPAATSIAHEGAGTEVVVTQTYSASIYNPAGPLVTTSTLGSYTQNPNRDHASSLSPATNPTLTTIAPTTAVSGTGTTALTAVTGVGFNKQSIVYANGVAIPTVFVNSTTLTATMPKKATAGTWPITVVTGGAVTTTAQTFTWS